MAAVGIIAQNEFVDVIFLRTKIVPVVLLDESRWPNSEEGSQQDC